MTQLRVAFLGLGHMGAPMARHVARAGHDLAVWNRTPSKAASIEGARVAATPAEAAKDRDVVVLMLADPAAVSDVLFGVDGVATGAAPSTLVVDASTIGSAAARSNADRLRKHGLRYVDAPVNGSTKPATDGTLGVVAGGETEDFATAAPLLHLWGSDVRHVGPVGAGSAAKLVRNLMLGVSIAAIGEALRLGNALDLPVELVHDIVANGPLGGSFTGVKAVIDSGVHGPGGFSMALMAKDLDLCTGAADGLAMASAAGAAALQAVASGHGGDDCRALAVHIATA